MIHQKREVDINTDKDWWVSEEFLSLLPHIYSRYFSNLLVSLREN